MRFAILLAATLTFAAVITAGVDTPSGSVVEQSGYAYFPPNRLDRVTVSWDRDVPVTYLIGTQHDRPRMFATIHEAFRRAQAQTGIRFTYGGRAATSGLVGTAEHPVVLVDFGTARGHPRLATYGSGMYAVGGPLLMPYGEQRVFAGGHITIDVQTTRDLGRGFGNGGLGDTLVHEIGHVLGLAHVSDPRQMMAPAWIRTDTRGWFHDGDLRGLRRLIHD